jgi:polyisoprenoid-binding protein YceI
MKPAIASHFVLLLFIPLLFSCEHKSGTGTETSGDTAAINHSPGLIEKLVSATSWTIDPNSSKVKFTIKNMGMMVDGSFGGLKGTLFFDEKNLKGSSCEASVDVNTINTGINKRDKDLMGEKFFNEDKYKHIVFRSDSITGSGNNFFAHGKLTIKGKAQRVKIPFTFSQNGNVGTFKSDFTLNRLDFGVGGDGPVMSSEVHVMLDVVTVKQ